MYLQYIFYNTCNELQFIFSISKYNTTLNQQNFFFIGNKGVIKQTLKLNKANTRCSWWWTQGNVTTKQTASNNKEKLKLHY